MPVFKEWNSDDYSLAAIWKIEESEIFFAEKTGITSDIKNPKRRIEHLAGRYLLSFLEKEFPLHDIHRDEHDKPRTKNNRFYFSISHSYPYVAAIVSPYREAGIDIQFHNKKVVDIQHKFLAPAEQQLFNNDIALINLAWCAKEAAYKWNGKRGLEFIAHLPITHFEENQNIFFLKIQVSFEDLKKKISLKGFVGNDFSICYVIN